MNQNNSPFRGYLIVGLLGVLTGSLITTILTRAIPKMGTNLISGLAERCFRPGGFCHEMLKRYGVETSVER
jgi:hypothetical protein